MIFGYLVIRMRRVCDVRAGRSSFVLWPQNVVSHLTMSISLAFQILASQTSA